MGGFSIVVGSVPARNWIGWKVFFNPRMGKEKQDSIILSKDIAYSCD